MATLVFDAEEVALLAALTCMKLVHGDSSTGGQRVQHRSSGSSVAEIHARWCAWNHASSTSSTPHAAGLGTADAAKRVCHDPSTRDGVALSCPVLRRSSDPQYRPYQLRLRIAASGIARGEVHEGVRQEGSLFFRRLTPSMAWRVGEMSEGVIPTLQTSLAFLEKKIHQVTGLGAPMITQDSLGQTGTPNFVCGVISILRIPTLAHLLVLSSSSGVRVAPASQVGHRPPMPAQRRSPHWSDYRIRHPNNRRAISARSCIRGDCETRESGISLGSGWRPSSCLWSHQPPYTEAGIATSAFMPAV